MWSLRRHLQRWSWIALVAVLGAALLPTLARALSAGDRTSWVEVCTAQGMKWVAVADASSDKTPLSVQAALDHCPYCTLEHHVPALPPSTQPLPLAIATSDALPALFLHAPRTLHAWRTAQARAPPAHS
jgi:hypothetical protein